MTRHLLRIALVCGLFATNFYSVTSEAQIRRYGQALNTDRFIWNSRVTQDHKEILRSDLELLKSLKGSSATALNAKIYGFTNFDGASYYSFLTRFVRGVRGMSRPTFADAQVFAGADFINLSEGFYRMTPLARIGILLHETQHLASGKMSHADCPVPFVDTEGRDILSEGNRVSLAGRAACDVSPTSPYGAQVVFFKNLRLFCTTCSNEILREAARLEKRYVDRILSPRAREILSRDH